MSKESLLELAVRIEAADGPQQNLDAEIELLTGNWTQYHYDAWHHFQMAGESVNPPMYEPVGPNRYTASLDAVMTLVPKEWITSKAGQDFDGIPWFWTLQPMFSSHLSVYAEGHTAALALCAAVLRALAYRLT